MIPAKSIAILIVFFTILLAVGDGERRGKALICPPPQWKRCGDSFANCTCYEEGADGWLKRVKPESTR